MLSQAFAWLCSKKSLSRGKCEQTSALIDSSVGVYVRYIQYVYGFRFKSDVSNHLRFAMLIEWLIVSFKLLMFTLVIRINLTCAYRDH